MPYTRRVVKGVDPVVLSRLDFDAKNKGPPRESKRILLILYLPYNAADREHRSRQARAHGSNEILADQGTAEER